MKFILWLKFVPKGGVTHYIHVLLDGPWKLFMHYWLTFREYLCAFMQIFMPYWNFEYTKALTLHCMGGKIDPATELVTHFGLNFFQERDTADVHNSGNIPVASH